MKDGGATLSVRDDPEIVTAKRVSWSGSEATLLLPKGRRATLSAYGATVTLTAGGSSAACVQVR